MAGALAAGPRLTLAADEPDVAGPYHRLLIRNATVIDGTGAPASGPMSILIEKGTIAQISRADALRKAGSSGDKDGQEGGFDRVIDATGGFVMPGIIDAHTPPSSPADYAYTLWLGHGITAVRIFPRVGVEAAVAEKGRVMSGQTLGPKMWVYPFWPDTAQASRPEEVPAMVRKWKALGVDGVKTAGGPGEYPDVLKVLGVQTQRNGLGMAIHIAQSAEPGINAMIAAGDNVSSIEHCYGYAESVLTGRTVPGFDPGFNYLYEPDHYRTSADLWKEVDLGRLDDEVVPALARISREGRLTMVPTYPGPEPAVAQDLSAAGDGTRLGHQ